MGSKFLLYYAPSREPYIDNLRVRVTCPILLLEDADEVEVILFRGGDKFDTVIYPDCEVDLILKARMIIRILSDGSVEYSRRPAIKGVNSSPDVNEVLVDMLRATTYDSLIHE